MLWCSPLTLPLWMNWSQICSVPPSEPFIANTLLRPDLLPLQGESWWARVRDCNFPLANFGDYNLACN